MKWIFTFLMLLTLGAQSASAQKILKIYRGSNKAIEYHIGDELHFKLKGEDHFYEFKIKDLDFEKKAIRFETGYIPLKNIVAIEHYGNYRTANAVQKSLYTFGGAWLLFSGVDIAMDSEDAREVGIRAAIVAGFSFVAGYLIKKFWGTQIFRFDTDEYLLGIVDLTVTSPNP
ncbi:MAG: hypothetical protein ACPG19_12520 [Saprospiraceae bacterium]